MIAIITFTNSKGKKSYGAYNYSTERSGGLQQNISSAIERTEGLGFKRELHKYVKDISYINNWGNWSYSIKQYESFNKFKSQYPEYFI